jgi:hypothetical protein
MAGLISLSRFLTLMSKRFFQQSGNPSRGVDTFLEQLRQLLHPRDGRLGATPLSNIDRNVFQLLVANDRADCQHLTACVGQPDRTRFAQAMRAKILQLLVNLDLRSTRSRLFIY